MPGDVGSAFGVQQQASRLLCSEHLQLQISAHELVVLDV